MKPKLTLRDLFWLVLVCAMGCGWWVEHRAKQRQEMAFRKQYMELGAEMFELNLELTMLRGPKRITD